MSDERDWLAMNDPVLSILTDLIEELRTVNSEANLPPFNDMADRAEARLREVTGDE